MIHLTLINCPFCGSRDATHGRKGIGEQWVIKCPDCYAEGPPAANVSAAAANWNRRPRFEAYREAVKASQQTREMDKLFNPEMQS